MHDEYFCPDRSDRPASSARDGVREIATPHHADRTLRDGRPVVTEHDLVDLREPGDDVPRLEGGLMLPEAEALTARIRATLSAGDALSTPLGRWRVVRVCCFQSRPEPDRPGFGVYDALGRTVGTSHAYWRPRFVLGQTLRRALCGDPTALQDAPLVAVAFARALLDGQVVCLPRLALFDQYGPPRQGRVRLRTRFDYDLRVAAAWANRAPPAASSGT